MKVNKSIDRPVFDDSNFGPAAREKHGFIHRNYSNTKQQLGAFTLLIRKDLKSILLITKVVAVAERQWVEQRY